MLTDRTEIHVGDCGTVYFIPVFDDDTELTSFDPTPAPIKQLRFRMPGAAGLCVRTATAAQRTIDGAEVWCLEYIVTVADVAPWASESVGGFHQQPGRISIEGYVEFSASQKWASSIAQMDWQRRPLRVAARLSA